MDTGTRLGSYEIIHLLGKGGMGEVYRAFDTRLNRAVAVKVLPTSFINCLKRDIHSEPGRTGRNSQATGMHGGSLNGAGMVLLGQAPAPPPGTFLRQCQSGTHDFGGRGCLKRDRPGDCQSLAECKSVHLS